MNSETKRDKGVLQMLSEYNFEKPIIKEIIFEDSDEETFKNNTGEESINLANVIETNDSQRDKALDMPNLDNIPIEKHTMIKDIMQEIFTDIDKNVNKRNGAYKKSPNKKLKITEKKSKKSNNTISAKSSDSNFLKINNQNNLEKPETSITIIESLPHSVENETNTPEQIINNLLKSLSKNIIFILNSYYISQYYWAAADTEKRKTIINNFTTLKKKVFDLSYNTIINIIIPKHKDHIFMNKFISEVHQLVDPSKKIGSFSISEIRELVNELIKWASKKRGFIPTTDILQSRFPTLTQQLCNNNENDNYPPSQQAPVTSTCTKEASHSSNPLLFRDNQLIGHDETIRQNQTSCQPNYQSTTWKYPSTSKSYCSFQSENNSHGTGQKQMNQNVQKAQSSMRSYHDHNQPMRQILNNNESQGHTKLYEQRTWPYQYNNNGHNISSPPCCNLITCNTHLASRGHSSPTNQNYKNSVPHTNVDCQPPSYEIHIVRKNVLSTSTGSVSTNSTSLAQTQEATQMTQCQSHQSNLMARSRNQNNYNLAKNAVNTNKIDLQPFDTNRSSISRDSGFMSPENPNNIIEDANVQQESRMPTISHVTSFNPEFHIKYDLCRVCARITKNKCINCLGAYYCSNSCQLVDWSCHWPYCKKK